MQITELDAVCVCVCVCVLLSCVRLFATPCILCVCVLVTQSCPILCEPMDQIPLSMEFSRQEYRSGLPSPSPGDLPDQGLAMK